ncbi:hypothetical protein WL88_25990 [Burkholderia diffusa]|uniref:Uncharacterized protein n=1 Tax=Burkholderia diffusa TaxID=488732 RepID=A0AAW3PA00_9BURK|nr:hypothetical protein WL86_30035 [Burkholderia diffusa]KWF38714.1 hypothetical protein WL85_11175 [Burkholderia diffusa]KWF46759.1 hypothetical protein WL88_25990 [Burkholderia diffusa]KWF50671.1 hypothetical protein WL87_15930 [Burkholderia diffusa]
MFAKHEQHVAHATVVDGFCIDLATIGAMCEDDGIHASDRPRERVRLRQLADHDVRLRQQ